MQKRHFLVREIDGILRLREIDPAIAHRLHVFGTPIGSCERSRGQAIHKVESIRWFFYFLNTNMTRDRADEIAAQLTEEFMNGTRAE